MTARTRERPRRLSATSWASCGAKAPGKAKTRSPQPVARCRRSCVKAGYGLSSGAAAMPNGFLTSYWPAPFATLCEVPRSSPAVLRRRRPGGRPSRRPACTSSPICDLPGPGAPGYFAEP